MAQAPPVAMSRVQPVAPIPAREAFPTPPEESRSPRLAAARRWLSSASRPSVVTRSRSSVRTSIHEFHHTQGKVLVTKNGRVKMVHDNTLRDEDWESHCLPAHHSLADPIRLEALPAAASDRFVLNVLNDGSPPFVLDASRMTVASLVEGVDSRSALKVGDSVVAVDSKPVADFAEYCREIEGKAAVALTVQPLQEDVLSDHDFSTDLSTPRPTWSGATSGRIAQIEFNTIEVARCETVGDVVVPLRRVGDLSRSMRWNWSTKNGNVAQHLFADLCATGRMEGEVVFDVGQSVVSIRLPVPSDPAWNAESLYWAYLLPEEDSRVLAEQDGVRVILGANTHVSVHSLNLVSFPDGAYGSLDKLLEEGSVEPNTLAWKFVRHTALEIPAETRWGIGLSLVPPALFYLSQLTFGVLVNCAIADRDSAQCNVAGVDFSAVVFSERYEASFLVLGFVAVVKFIFTAVAHGVEVYKRRLRLRGKAMKNLRAHMFTTMLQMSDTARFNFDSGDIEKCLDTEVEVAVTMVWMRMFRFVEEFGGLLAKLILAVQIVVGLKASQSTAVLLACIPIMAICASVTFNLRRRQILHLYGTTFTKEENLMAFVIMSVAATPLIRTYQRGWHFTRAFGQCHQSYNDVAFKADASSAHTVSMFKYMFVLVSGIVTVVGGRQVRLRTLSAGEFLVLLRTIDSFGSDIISAVKTSNDMLFGSAAIRKIASVLNAESWRLESQSRVFPEDAAQKMDDDHIELKAVHYEYPLMQEGQDQAVAPLNLVLPIGKLICFPGKSLLSGRATSDMPGVNTLFSLIAGRLLPTTGSVLVPERWRIVYVPVIPIMFDGTLLYNLMFSDHATNPQLAWHICAELGMSPGLIQKADFDVGTDGHSLSFSDRVIISIARALLHDVDLLLISSALDVLGEERGAQVLRFLADFSRRGGLANDRMPVQLRHRKTILYTSKFKMLQEQASFVVRKGQNPQQGRCDPSIWSSVDSLF